MRKLTDKEIFEGFAFKADEAERQSYIRKRHKEIAHLAETMKIKKYPKYGRCQFTGSLACNEAKQLSAGDLLIIADHGNVCFGGQVIKRGDSFSGSYNTD